MAEFAYNNAKNVITGYTPFELNCGYHLCVSFDKDTNPRSQSKTADELSTKLLELMTICWENFHHTQELQKQAHNKGVKPRSYVPNDKVWLNSKYIKTKQNRKFKTKFFRPFWLLHLIGKQAYKLELAKWWRIHDIFQMLLLEQNTTRKGWVDEKITELKFKAGNSKEYKVEVIRNSAVYANKVEGYLLGLYYLVA